MIEVQVDKLLKKHSRTFYWLAKKTGISHTTLAPQKGKGAWDQLRHAREDMFGFGLPAGTHTSASGPKEAGKVHKPKKCIEVVHILRRSSSEISPNDPIVDSEVLARQIFFKNPPEIEISCRQ